MFHSNSVPRVVAHHPSSSKWQNSRIFFRHDLEDFFGNRSQLHNLSGSRCHQTSDEDFCKTFARGRTRGACRIQCRTCAGLRGRRTPQASNRRPSLVWHLRRSTRHKSAPALFNGAGADLFLNGPASLLGGVGGVGFIFLGKASRGVACNLKMSKI